MQIPSSYEEGFLRLLVSTNAEALVTVLVMQIWVVFGKRQKWATCLSLITLAVKPEVSLQSHGQVIISGSILLDGNFFNFDIGEDGNPLPKMTFCTLLVPAWYQNLKETGVCSIKVL